MDWAARERVRERFELGKVVGMYEKVYEDVLKERGGDVAMERGGGVARGREGEKERREGWIGSGLTGT